MNKFILILFFGLTFSLFFLNGCGQKGPLYLPKKTAAHPQSSS
jgi:predicted small lipoprotein YifL